MADMQNIGGYPFEIGYPLDTTTFNNIGAVYVIYTSSRFLDVGESGELGNRITGHDRKFEWRRNSNNEPIFVAVHQEGDQTVRLAIESNLRNTLNPICGDR